MTQTAQQQMVMVGQHGMLRMESIAVMVHVIDSRYVFGRTDLLVTPVNGKGSQWVERGRVSMVQA